jgi:hypothetical protein
MTGPAFTTTLHKNIFIKLSFDFVFAHTVSQYLWLVVNSDLRLVRDEIFTALRP